MKSVASLSAAAAVLSGSANAFWRLPCHKPIALGRIDPIVNPGVAASHAHTIHGGNNFGPSTHYEDLRSSQCSSCQVKEDKSAYWTPTLHFVHESGEVEIADQVGGMLSYYLLYGDNITAFPEGFVMLAGDPRQRNFSGPVPDLPTSLWTPEETTQFSLMQKSIGFNCLNYNKAPEGSRYRHTMPDKEFMDQNCVDGIRAEIMFPSCWNGKDLDSPNHRSHVAYPSMIDGGECPKGYETRLPTLFFETIWDTYKFKDQAGQFVWSHGDPIGCGYHGDFMNGWPRKMLQQAIDTCTNLSGRVEDCPVFADQLQTESEMEKCHIESMPSVCKKDNCTGPTDNLCGDVPIQYGPGYAAAPSPNQGGKDHNKPTLSSVALPVQPYAPARSKGPGGISVYNVEKPTPTSSSLPCSSPASSPSAPEYPEVTPAAKDVPKNEKDDGIIGTTTYVKDGVVYVVAIKEVEVFVNDPLRRRHAHAHRRNIARN